jgi:hypothetical protein
MIAVMRAIPPTVPPMAAAAIGVLDNGKRCQNENEPFRNVCLACGGTYCLEEDCVESGDEGEEDDVDGENDMDDVGDGDEAGAANEDRADVEVETVGEECTEDCVCEEGGDGRDDLDESGANEDEAGTKFLELLGGVELAVVVLVSDILLQFQWRWCNGMVRFCWGPRSCRLRTLGLGFYHLYLIAVLC